MNTKNPYHRHRFPSEIISHCVWLYYRFSLSYRDIELMMAERGLDLTYESIRYWCLKFGHLYAKQMRKRKVWGDTWHLDEVFCRINGQVHYLCVLWIKMVKYWTYWFSVNAINKRQTDSFTNSRNKAIHQGKSSPTNWPAIAHHAECISH